MQTRELTDEQHNHHASKENHHASSKLGRTSQSKQTKKRAGQLEDNERIASKWKKSRIKGIGKRMGKHDSKLQRRNANKELTDEQQNRLMRIDLQPTASSIEFRHKEQIRKLTDER
jgi:hypothetical protein